MNYNDFLNSKKEKRISKGIEVEEDDLNNVLFDYQKAIVKKALKMKRYCLFESCGMGKHYSNWSGLIKSIRILINLY